ncbi:TetR/AcrR family transcriptional regulator [Methylocapsa palsarum]|uniref:DNA-binding transcriptional regulator, AcrR family n=1 Tax=Methylocapsa palsarum TaxID=1612308 RepID=A0A1I4DDH6_9HYPH|nr:TetR/AcrR family transcriptional regulator [Methylocapsa palsarum]SFK91542.1 DNA-binding transcriptional regulator, AcrR family [Methylocapsa palsarum]
MVDTAVRKPDTYSEILEVAEHLFEQLGFQKTTVADIAHEMQMSPANIYRFFAAKGEINQAVADRLLAKVIVEIRKIARASGPASAKLRVLIFTVEKLNSQRFSSDRKLHDLLEAAYNAHWPIVAAHDEAVNKVFAQVISDGMAAGEFREGDSDLAAILVRSACIRFFHPRLVVEYAQDPEPTVDQMVDLCLAALAKQPQLAARLAGKQHIIIS